MFSENSPKQLWSVDCLEEYWNQLGFCYHAICCFEQFFHKTDTRQNWTHDLSVYEAAVLAIIPRNVAYFWARLMLALNWELSNIDSVLLFMNKSREGIQIGSLPGSCRDGKVKRLIPAKLPIEQTFDDDPKHIFSNSKFSRLGAHLNRSSLTS